MFEQEVKIINALKPGLEQLPGDGVYWPEKPSKINPIVITWQGIEMPLKRWEEYTQVTESGIRYRLKKGYSIGEALTKKPLH